MEILDLFAYLIKLERLQFIEIQFLPKAIQQDLINFTKGNSLTNINDKGQALIPQKLYSEWLEKLNQKGFDYEFDSTNISIPRNQSLNS